MKLGHRLKLQAAALWEHEPVLQVWPSIVPAKELFQLEVPSWNHIFGKLVNISFIKLFLLEKNKHIKKIRKYSFTKKCPRISKHTLLSHAPSRTCIKCCRDSS